MKSCKVFSLVHTDISLGTMEESKFRVIIIHGLMFIPTTTKMPLSTSKTNVFFYEITIQQSPCILCISCDPNSGNDQFQPTGVDLLSSLQQNIQMRGVEYHLGAMILSNENHFCSIVLDPIPLGDIKIFMIE